nr:J domain-containing protein [Lysinibacillus timonensis]
MNNFYDRLGIGLHASRDEVKMAYRKLAKQYHPDVNHGNPNAAKRFKEIKEAYETLYSPELRKKYDAKLGIQNKGEERESHQSAKASRESYQQDFDPSKVHQTFEQFFGFNPKTKERTQDYKSEQQRKNPLDTSELFNKYFGRG